MTPQQKAYLLTHMRTQLEQERNNKLDSAMEQFGLTEQEQQLAKKEIEALFSNGISHLNENQFNNIAADMQQNGFSAERIARRLEFYELDKHFYPDIITFFEYKSLSEIPVAVDELDASFKGIQVVTTDNFNDLISQGYTGYWILDPERIKTRRLQVASMNEGGSYPRGYYFNADITEVEEITTDGKKRYRIYFRNPVIINTGNRNVRFNQNPVKYF